MIIAIPIAQGQLSLHFGHCESFRLFHVDEEKKIVKIEEKTPPPHEPGVLPKWLHEEGANIIITGGMGMMAQQLFARNDIQVIVGAPAKAPEEVVKDWLCGALETVSNPCDH